MHAHTDTRTQERKRKRKKKIKNMSDMRNVTFTWTCLKNGHSELEVNVKGIWNLPALVIT